MRFFLALTIFVSFQAFAKTYVISSHQTQCNQTLIVESERELSNFSKTMVVSFKDNQEEKIFIRESINRYYDSMWIDYYAQDGEKLEYFWDDGHGISEGIRFRNCLYNIQ